MSENDTRKRVFLQVLISVGATAALVVHIVRPSLKIDGVAIVLFAVALLPWLAPLFKSIEMPGGWKFEFREFRREVTQGLAENKQRVESLADRVEKLAIAFSGSVTPELQEELTSEVERFHHYLGQRGIALPSAPPSVRLTEGLRDKMMTIAYYEPSQNMIEMDEAYADEPDVILREYSHHVLLSELAADGDSRWSTDRGYVGVESGLAMYLPCSFHQDPVFARKVSSREGVADLWDLTNDKPLDLEGAMLLNPMAEGEVWGAIFWKLREELSSEVADRVVVSAWSDAYNEEGPDFRSVFARALVRTVRTEAKERAAGDLRAILAKRGIDLRS